MHAALQSSSSSYTLSFFLFFLPSSEEDKRSVKPSLRLLETVGRASEPSERALDLMGKGEDRGIAHLRSLHLIHLRFPRAQPTLCIGKNRTDTARNAGECSLSLRKPPRAYTFSEKMPQKPPSRADSERSTLKQTTHRLCVSPVEIYICKEERTACNAICSCPSPSFVALIAIEKLNLSACKGQTTPNKTHNREWQTHTE